MQQSVHFASIGILIFIKPTPLYVAVGDTVKFYSVTVGGSGITNSPPRIIIGS